ncbi:MAG: hypothetical protein OEV91_06200, partial [Desulfobulbaceae bacterium]|nr:hypothetical protein [Desulfobulbaceae bacterium]
RKRKVFSVLEFGVGWSTIVLADALRRNRNDWDRLENKPNIRKSHSFVNFSVDSSQDWIANTEKRIPPELRPYTKLAYSRVQAGTYCGKICHYYQKLPDIVPDFIYLDGPDTMAVEDQIGGISWKNNGRVVMAADLLLLEPVLLPGTLLLVDGRTSNARFLKAHFYRNWDFLWDKDSDITIMELREEPIGLFNEADLRYRLDSFYDQWKNIAS